jgi:PKHD-type hydroxylase
MPVYQFVKGYAAKSAIMLLVVPDVLPHEEAIAMGLRLKQGEWDESRCIAGPCAALVRKNQQLDERTEAARGAQHRVQSMLAAHPLFLSASLPKYIYPPLFNRYGVGDGFGAHIDNAVRSDPQSGLQLRTDLSATLFLSDPDEYEGGELVVENPFGNGRYKLKAGHMLLYAASSIHSVTKVLRGERIACFFWLESLVADQAEREMLFDLDQTVQRLTADRGPSDKEVLRLTKLYHNLVRRWSA